MPGVNSRLKCRGQVIATTQTVTYEVTVKELGYRPEPYCLADALMYADGKPIVEITNMSLRMSGLTREKLEARRGRGEARRRSAGALRLRLDPRLLERQAVRGIRRAVQGLRLRARDRAASWAAVPVPRSHHRASTGEPFVLKAGAACEARVRCARRCVVLRREPQREHAVRRSVGDRSPAVRLARGVLRLRADQRRGPVVPQSWRQGDAVPRRSRRTAAR